MFAKQTVHKIRKHAAQAPSGLPAVAMRQVMSGDTGQNHGGAGVSACGDNQPSPRSDAAIKARTLDNPKAIR